MSAFLHLQKPFDIFLVSFFVAAILTPFLRSLAFRLGLLDHPKQHGIHSHPVPRIGGVAIYTAFVIGALYRMDLSQTLKGVLLGSSLIFILGMVEDWLKLRAGIRLIIQILICGLMMFRYGVILDIFPNLYVNAAVTAIGIIGIINAVNFLDNMDGLASGLIFISCSALFAISAMSVQPWLSYLALALMGGTGGFLVFNLKRTHIFMGDAGSTFLGFTLASLTVMTEWSPDLSVTLAMPVLILGVPIIDMILITVLRVKEHKVKSVRDWIEYAGRDHLSHRLARLGLGTRGAVLACWLLQAIFCLIAVALFSKGPLCGVAGLIFFAIAMLSIIYFFWNKRLIFLMSTGRTLKKKTIR